MNIAEIGRRLQEKMGQLDALIIEAEKVIENDNQYWEEIQSGQDSEEAEQSGVLVGQKNGMWAVRDLLLFDLETAKERLDLTLRGLPSENDENFHRALGEVYFLRHGEPLYADPEWCRPFVEAARGAVEQGGEFDGCEVQYRETLRRAADAIAAVTYGPDHKINEPPKATGIDEPTLSNNELANSYISARQMSDADRLTIFENEIAHRLDLPLDETAQGFTNWAQNEVEKWVERHSG